MKPSKQFPTIQTPHLNRTFFRTCKTNNSSKTSKNNIFLSNISSI